LNCKKKFKNSDPLFVEKPEKKFISSFFEGLIFSFKKTYIYTERRLYDKKSIPVFPGIFN